MATQLARGEGMKTAVVMLAIAVVMLTIAVVMLTIAVLMLAIAMANDSVCS
jgi:hypothetical protein